MISSAQVCKICQGAAEKNSKQSQNWSVPWQRHKRTEVLFLPSFCHFLTALWIFNLNKMLFASYSAYRSNLQSGWKCIVAFPDMAFKCPCFILYHKKHRAVHVGSLERPLGEVMDTEVTVSLHSSSLLISVRCYFFALHMKRLSFHLSFFQIINLDLYIFARHLEQQRSGLSWGLWILKF